MGLLDEDLFLYGEELDLCEKIQQAGYQIHWVPASVVTHIGRASTDQISAQAFLEHYVSKHHFFCKRSGRAVGTAYKLFLLITAFSRIALGPLAYLRPQEDREEWLRLSRSYRRLVVSILSGKFTSIRHDLPS